MSSGTPWTSCRACGWSGGPHAYRVVETLTTSQYGPDFLDDQGGLSSMRRAGGEEVMIPEIEFRAAISKSGLTPPDQIMADGRSIASPQTASVATIPAGTSFYPDGVAAGAYGCWRTDLKGSWRADIGRSLTLAEEKAYQAKVDAARRERVWEEARRQAEARDEAGTIWKASKPAPSDHLYLVKKGVKAHGLRVHNGELVIPMRDGGDLRSLQFIGPDGHERFLSGGRVAGCVFNIGELNGATAFCICEGFATGASIHEATSYPVAVAFNAGNLLPVAKAVRERFPELDLLVCADHDARTPVNPGLTKGTEAAQAVGGRLAVPGFGPGRPDWASDFNDLAQLNGLETVRRAIVGNSDANQGDAPGPAVDATRTEPGLTDLGNAHRFARDHRENVRYCWPWGGGSYGTAAIGRRDETGEIHRLAEATVRGMYEEAARSSQERREALATWAVKCESHERRIKNARIRSGYRGIPIQPEDMDRDPWLLNVGNGTIDLRTGTLRPHAREDLITRGIDMDYDPDAKCPTWERFIHEVFGDNAETIAFVQRAIGYSLTGTIIEHVLIVLYGLGSNGKTTLIDALHYLLGPYAKHATHRSATGPPRGAPSHRVSHTARCPPGNGC